MTSSPSTTPKVAFVTGVGRGTNPRVQVETVWVQPAPPEGDPGESSLWHRGTVPKS